MVSYQGREDALATKPVVQGGAEHNDDRGVAETSLLPRFTLLLCCPKVGSAFFMHSSAVPAELGRCLCCLPDQQYDVVITLP
jgi:hypothetical protein